MTKETNMNTTEAEIKAVAKAVTASLRKQGHAAPHSAVLHALAGALNKRDWRVIKAELQGSSPTPADTQMGAQPLAAPELTRPEVPARFYTDCHTFTVNFDARAYLMQASDEALLGIMYVGYGGDYATDNVAEYFADRKLNPELCEAFDFLGAVNSRPLAETTGFECRIDAQAFLRWMHECRPTALAKYLCKEYGVILSQAQEEEILGMWDWRDAQGNACECSLPTEEAAALDAMAQLGLLEQELEAQDAVW